jgi:hypothetical protein
MAYAIIPSPLSPLGKTIELFDVPPGEDEAFLAAWTSAAPPGASLHIALRDDVQPRYAALSDPPGPADGVLLIAAAPADWNAVLARWTPRQGFISARLEGAVAVVHWSSPLMYQRAVQAHGELLPAAALYRRTST